MLFNSDKLRPSVIRIEEQHVDCLGRVMAIALASNGAKVYILGRRKEPLEATQQACPDNITPIVADVSSKQSLVNAAAQITSEAGYINVLIANAGIVYLTPDTSRGPVPGANLQVGRVLPSDPTASELQSFLVDTPEEEFATTYQINTAGVFYTIAAFVSLLDAGNKQGNAQQKSQVIAVGSAAAQNRYATGGCAYGMSKAALHHLMRQMMTYLVPLDIRANTISPGVFPSNLAGTPPATDITVEGSFPRSYIPLQRAGKEEEMAGTILYLTSKAGGFVNGALMSVDGGSTAYR